MPRRQQGGAQPRPSGRGSLILSLANRVSAMGMAVVVMVGLAMAAIVEQAVLPTSAKQRTATTRPMASAHAGPRRSHPSRSAKSRVPVTPATLLTKKVQSIALAERSATARKEYGGGNPGTPVVHESRVDHHHGWALGTEAIPPPDGMTVMPDSSLYLAHSTGTGGWEVALSGTAQFTTLLRKAPTSVVPADERNVLERYNTSAAKKTDPKVDSGLMLPWSVGQSWSLLATDTGVSGFDGGDGRVLAAADGRLYHLCATSPGHGMVILIHPGGLATEYYQMSDVTKVPDGTLVKRGDYLGQTSTEQACGGGEAPQRMVRFAVSNADSIVPLDQVQVGGWLLHETPAETFAQRAGVRVNADNPLLNFGVMPSPAQSPTARTSASPKPGKGQPPGKKAKSPAPGKSNGNA